MLYLMTNHVFYSSILWQDCMVIYPTHTDEQTLLSPAPQPIPAGCSLGESTLERQGNTQTSAPWQDRHTHWCAHIFKDERGKTAGLHGEGETYQDVKNEWRHLPGGHSEQIHW